MTRRSLLLCAGFAVALRALDRSEVLAALEPAAAALSDGNAPAFLQTIDRKAPERDELNRNVTALLQSFEVSSNIDVLEIADDTAEVRWQLSLRSRVNQMSAGQRDSVIKVQVARGKILRLQPVSFFALDVNRQ